MKRKVLTAIIFWLAVVLISGSVLGGVYAANASKKTEEESAKPSPIIERTDVEAKKELELSGKKIDLEYDKSPKNDKDTFDVYQAENQDEYSFNSEGVLTHYNPVNENPLEEVEITEAQAKEIAEKELLRVFPEQMKTYEFLSCKGRSQWTVYYAELFGKDKFIKGESIIVQLDLFGNIKYMRYYRRAELDSFDTTQLADLEKSDVDAWVLAEGKKSWGDDVILKEAQYSLREIDGECRVVILPSYQKPDNSFCNAGEYLIYPLDAE